MGKITISLPDKLITKIKVLFAKYGDKSKICQKAFEEAIKEIEENEM